MTTNTPTIPVSRLAPLSRKLLADAAGTRCGLTLPVHTVAAQPCDLLGPMFGGNPLANAAVPKDPVNAWQTVSGAVGLSADDAKAGALAEALERLAAARATFTLSKRTNIPAAELLDDAAFALFSPAQLAQPGFPWPMSSHAEHLYARVFRLADNRPFWVPQELVGLGPRSGEARMPSTSSGLAAWRDEAGGPWLAILRAAQELLERDALTATWLNGLGGRQLTLPAEWTDYVTAQGGEISAFDLTQSWNPCPVIAVAGGLPYAGKPRYVLGIACRASKGAALHKALLEWGQALAFATHLAGSADTGLPPRPEPEQLRRFDQHAVFYTLRPDLWHQTALIAHATPHESAPDPQHIQPEKPPAQQTATLLHDLQVSLANHGIDLYYHELTTVDVQACGLRVMRVISPQLSSLHADERSPFLGGRTANIEWRYPGCKRQTPFPNPLPHPLG